MKYGLAYRYLWMGPLETAHLNAEGLLKISYASSEQLLLTNCSIYKYLIDFVGWGSYVERYGPTMTRVMGDLKSNTDWTMEGTAKLRQQMEEMVPIDTLQVSSDIN